MRRGRWTLLAACLCAACAAKVPDLRRVSGFAFATDVGMRIPVGGLYRDEVGEMGDDFGLLLTAGAGLGYRIRGVELYAQARLTRDSSLGVEALYRFERAPILLLGGGVGVAATNGLDHVEHRDLALEVVLPRVDLRLPISPSWELSWTVLRLSYLDTRAFRDVDPYRELHGFAIASSFGLAARVDRAWEGRALAPRAGGVTIDGSLWLAIFTPVASERRDPGVAGEEATGERFWQRGAQVIRIAPGISIPVPWGFVEIGVPVSAYPFQGNGGVGLSLAWRPRTAGFLSMGAAVHWFPKGLLIAELPRIDLALRVSDAVDVTLTPVALLLVFEPARDVWVEEGMESKVPYWGLTFGLGGRWTIPAFSRTPRTTSPAR